MAFVMDGDKQPPKKGEKRRKEEFFIKLIAPR